MTDTQSFLERAAMAIANCLTIGWDAIHRDKAHWKATHGMLGGIYHELNDLRQEDCKAAANAALATFRTWLAENGMVVVPRFPTFDMEMAVKDEHIPHRDIYGDLDKLRIEACGVDVWQAMIAAAPDSGLEYPGPAQARAPDRGASPAGLGEVERLREATQHLIAEAHNISSLMPPNESDDWCISVRADDVRRLERAADLARAALKGKDND